MGGLEHPLPPLFLCPCTHLELAVLSHHGVEHSSHSSKHLLVTGQLIISLTQQTQVVVEISFQLREPLSLHSQLILYACTKMAAQLNFKYYHNGLLHLIAIQPLWNHTNDVQGVFRQKTQLMSRGILLCVSRG